MKGFVCALVVSCITIAGLVMVLTIVGQDAGAETVYIPTDWQVTEPTTLRNGTWQVNGTMSITGCTLTLEDAELLIGGSYSRPSFTVNSGAHLVARRSVISGVYGVTPYLYLYDDVLLDNTTVDYYYRLYSYGGSLTVDNSYLCGSYYSIYSRSNLVVRASEISATGNYALYWDASSTTTIDLVVEGSRFTTPAGSSYALYLQGPSSEGYVPRAVVRGCEISGFTTGIYLSYFLYSGSVTVEGNTCTDCNRGLYAYYFSSLITIRDNMWIPRASGTGIYIDQVYSTGADAFISNETVLGGERGIEVRYASDFELRAVTVNGSNQGVYSYNSYLDVRGSTVHGRTLDFYLSGSGRIHIYDTEHRYKAQASVSSNPIYRIAEIQTVSIEAVVWQSGLSIVHGVTVITNETGYPIGERSNELPRPLDLPTWLINYYGEVRATMVCGAFTDRGVRFLSRPVDIRNATSITLTIIDDRAPWATVAEPMSGDVFLTETFRVRGLCDDLGAGIYRVSVRFCDGPWVVADNPLDGTWSVVLRDLPDDLGELRVRVQDLAGNRNDTVVDGIVVDTAPPTLTLLRPLTCVSSSPATLVATTEPHARVFVNGMEVPVMDNGAFTASVELVEGPNAVTVLVRDLGGHDLTRVYTLQLDSVVPVLRVSSPVEGEWSSSSKVTVTGIVSEDVALTVNGIPRSVSKGTFSVSVPLSDPFTLITVVATDAAGNAAREDRLVNTDREAPLLQVLSPLSGTYGASDRLHVSGAVSDDGPVTVSVSGMPASVLDGQWSCELVLPEGSHAIRVTARDAAGNTVTVQVVHIVDLTAPEVMVRLIVAGTRLEPSSGAFHTKVPLATAEVTLDESCMVRVTGVAPEVIGAGTRTLEVPLVSGINDVRVDISDIAGNRATPVVFRVVSDSIAPSLALALGASVSTRDPDLLVQGTTEPDCHVLVEGVEVTVLADGSFSTVVHLDAGLNRIEVISMDPAGNRAGVTLDAELDQVKVDARSSDDMTAGLAIGLIVGLFLAALVFRWGRRPARAGRGPAAAAPAPREPEVPQPPPERPRAARVEERVEEARQYDMPRTRVVRRDER